MGSQHFSKCSTNRFTPTFQPYCDKSRHLVRSSCDELLDEPWNAAQGAERPATTLSIRDLPTGHDGINLLRRNSLHVVDTGRGETNGHQRTTRVTTVLIGVHRDRDIPAHTSRTHPLRIRNL